MNVGIDIDGILIKYYKFMIDYGIPFFKERYNIDIKNKEGSKIKEIFDCNNLKALMFWLNELNVINYYTKSSAREGAREFTNKVHEENGNIYIITSRAFTTTKNPLGYIMKKITYNWLKNNNIYYDKIIYCKSNKLSSIIENNIDYMFEDLVCNINEISKYIPVICFDDAPYNENCHNVTRLKDFYEAYEYINDGKKLIYKNGNNIKINKYNKI